MPIGRSKLPHSGINDYKLFTSALMLVGLAKTPLGDDNNPVFVFFILVVGIKYNILCKINLF